MIRFKRFATLLSMSFLFIGAQVAVGQSSSFTYQGRLQDGGTNANGSYDFQFTLWDALSGGTQQPQPSPVTVTRTSVAVANGVFTVQLDFGANAFPGASRWLETSARLAGGGAFTILSPRQPITSTPYAVRSASAGNADTATSATTATNATQLGGVAANQYVQTNDSRLTDSRPPTPGSSAYIQNTSSQQANSNFNISGNGTVGTLSANSVNAGFVQANGSVSANDINATRYNTLSGVRSFTVDGFFNVFAGIGAGQASSNILVGKNSFFGFDAGDTNILGQQNTAVGYLADVGSSSLTNATAIGANAQVNQSNSIVLGSISGLNAANANTNVGIGTAAPAVPLEVRRDGAVASDWQQGQLRISGQANPARQLSLGYDTSSNLGVIQAGEAGVAFRDLLLNPSGGNVGISTTAPSFKLHVNGETRTNTLSIDAYVANNGGPALCANTANNRVALCTSSLRYKTNVQSFRNGLGIISRLHPISFDWKDGGTHDVGLAAEEVDKVEPLLTFRNNKGEIEGVKYNQLSAVFINAFKEQQAQILEQQDELKKEKAQLKQQESVLTRQEHELEALKKLVCSSHRRASACR